MNNKSCPHKTIEVSLTPVGDDNKRMRWLAYSPNILVNAIEHGCDALVKCIAQI